MTRKRRVIAEKKWNNKTEVPNWKGGNGINCNFINPAKMGKEKSSTKKDYKHKDRRNESRRSAITLNSDKPKCTGNLCLF